MANFIIRPVLTSLDKKKFINFIYSLYKDDPMFVAPLKMERKKLIDTKKNPFYKHAKLALFLAERNGEVIGRIGAVINDNHNKEHADKVGFFGFFECVNDQEVANALFEEAKNFLKTNGMTAMRGPASPSVNDEYGMLYEGFDSPPYVMMPYNPPYYNLLCERYGFKYERELYAYSLSKATIATDKIAHIYHQLKEKNKIKIRFFNLNDFDNEVKRLMKLYNEVWQYNWGAVPMTEEEFKSAADDMKMILIPELIVIAEYQGQPIGFGLTLPDINIALKYNKSGRLLSGLWHLYTKKKKINQCRVVALGVLPTFQKTGAAAAIVYETVLQAIKNGFIFYEESWVLENNAVLHSIMDALHAAVYKKYRIYQMDI